MDHTELADTLKAWRERVTTSDVGLPTGGRRRTPGLRREELAHLAGISVDYLTRLEQARADHPSSQVVTALARALRLSADERHHLFLLSGHTAPEAGRVPAFLTPGVQRLLDRLLDIPVSVHDASWTLIAWNPLWAALLGDPTVFTGRDRNLVWRYFTQGSQRIVRSPEGTADFEYGMVADLRTAASRYPDDPDLRALVADLRTASDRFTELWDGHHVASRTADHKTVDHPSVGRITLDCDVLTVQGSDLRVIAYTAAPGSQDADRLALVGVLGLQTV